MIGLCDCNSFYASCEALFRPDLKGRGIVVLSNNDGCVVTANKEAKQNGITRGLNWFEVKDIAAKRGVKAFSSNYPLYQSISDRVMTLLSQKTYEIFPYSIDEAFFTPGVIKPEELRYEITNESGIPVSIGLGRTKTLAKIANHIAKKEKSGAFILNEADEDEVLKNTDIIDVWGIGYRNSEKLKKRGIYTAKAFRDLDDDFILKLLTVTGLRTALELRGVDAHQESIKNASFASGITFSHPIVSYDELYKTLVSHAQTLSEKLEKKGLESGEIAIQIFTSRFKSDFYTPFVKVKLIHPTSYLPTFSKAIGYALSICYKKAAYKGSRVFALDIHEKGERQYNLFYNDNYSDERNQRLTSVVCELNKKYGRGEVTTLSALGLTKDKMTKAELKSPAYTTRFTDLPLILDR
ncbi:Y-family DNA polymerase [Bullifex sp.]|uniref:Y-family DNA polymerase n=1 Tax=Bullifex sp. TaxID=2815808 RepID=UPI002A81B197|nr:Y-family DNA polymerase [Bullifex sp.]MDY4066230.1 Y-family DNA polymerase [Bullifex sp.]